MTKIYIGISSTIILLVVIFFSFTFYINSKVTNCRVSAMASSEFKDFEEEKKLWGIEIHHEVDGYIMVYTFKYFDDLKNCLTENNIPSYKIDSIIENEKRLLPDYLRY